MQARALTQLQLQPGNHPGVPPGTGQHTRRLRPRHQHNGASRQGHLIHREPAEPPGQLARTGRAVRFGDRRHDAGPPFVLPHVASSCHDAALGMCLLTVPLGSPTPGTVQGPRIAATAAMMQGIV